MDEPAGGRRSWSSSAALLPLNGRPGPPGGPILGPMMEPGGNRALAGAVLIVLGLGLFALQIVGGLSDAVVLFLVGGVFVFFYFARRVYGLLIPGCILLGLGLGRVGEVAGFARGEVEGIGLGVGFLAIYLIDTIYRRRSHWWPL